MTSFLKSGKQSDWVCDMPLTLPTNWSAAAQSKHVVSDFLLELGYDDTTPGNYFFSTMDRKVTNHYLGSVLDWGEIMDTISLQDSIASTADLKIKLANIYPNESGLLSDELFGGSKTFLNQTVRIRSWLAGCSTTSDCLTRFVGNLKDIQYDLEYVHLTVERSDPTDRAWAINDLVDSSDADGLRLPEDSVGLVRPVIYGDKRTNLNAQASYGVTAATWDAEDPIGYTPAVYLGNEKWLIADHQVEGIGSNNDLIYAWDEILKDFVQLQAADYTVVQNTSAGCIIQRDTHRYIQIRYPLTCVDGGGATAWSNPSNLVDGDISTETTITLTDSDDGQLTLTFTANDDIQEAGSVTDVRLMIRGEGDWATANCKLYVEGNSSNIFSSGSILTYFNGHGSSSGIAFPTFTIHMESTAVGSYDGSINACYLMIGYDVTRYGAEMPLFFAGRGVDKCSWTGGTALDATLMHRIHRDILKNYVGWDATGINYIEVNGTDWGSSTIDTDRDWDVEFNGLERVKAKTLLQQIQYEGCFIFIFDETETGVEARIVYVKDSYSSSDAELDGDYLSKIKVKKDQLSQIVSKRLANYNPSPLGDDTYQNQNSKTNSNRSDWDFDTNENVEEVDLDFLTTSADVDDFLDYYDNIHGEPKLIVSGMIDDPAHWGLQTGDVVEFSNMQFDPFGESWSGKYFMITKLQITPTKFKFTAREVG